MSVLEKLALGVGGLFMLLGVLRLARSPLKLVFRVAGNAALGFGACGCWAAWPRGFSWGSTCSTDC